MRDAGRHKRPTRLYFTDWKNRASRFTWLTFLKEAGFTWRIKASKHSMLNYYFPGIMWFGLAQHTRELQKPFRATLDCYKILALKILLEQDLICELMIRAYQWTRVEYSAYQEAWLVLASIVYIHTAKYMHVNVHWSHAVQKLPLHCLFVRRWPKQV